MNTILETIIYIASAPFFWPALGTIIGTSMFVGAAIYDGELKAFSKGVLLILTYSFLLLAVLVPRISSQIITHDIQNLVMAWAGTVTVAVVTLAYVLGMVWGILVVKHTRSK